MLADSRIDREVETLPPGRLLQHSNFWHRGNLAIVVSDVQSLQIPRLAARTFSQSFGLERHGCDALLLFRILLGHHCYNLPPVFSQGRLAVFYLICSACGPHHQ
jgi:hypothetical protein